MMKTRAHTFTLGTALLIALAVLVSCNKERHETAPETIDAVENLVTLTNRAYLATEISGGDEQTSFSVSNDGLIDEYLAGERHFDNYEKSHSKRFIRCLRSVDLEEVQLSQARRVLKVYETRNEKIVQRHRQAFFQLHERMEAQRNALIRQLHSEQIDRIEFKRKMTLLRDQYQQGLRRIKESNADAFSRSFRMLMHQLHGILDAGQWNDFTNCLKR